MKLIYVAGAYRSPLGAFAIHENIERARGVACLCWVRGWAVICPHLNSAHMCGLVPDQAFLEGDLEMLRRSDAIVMVSGWECSAGATAELAEARRLGLEVFHDVPPVCGG